MSHRSAPGEAPGRQRQERALLAGFTEHLIQELNRSPLTAAAYLGDLREFSDYLDAGSLSRASISDVRNYLITLATRRVGARTIRRRLSAIRTFYRYMKLAGLRPDNPAGEVPGPQLLPRDPEHLKVSEVSHLLRASPPGRTDFQRLRDRAIVEVLYATGIRRAEVTSIDLHGVDLETRTVKVTGKGRKNRVVPMNRTAAAAIQAYLGVRPRTSDRALFIGRSGKRLTPKHVWRIFKDLYRASGLQKHATPHTLRHSFATHMVENDADLETVREFLGHEHLSTTGIYLKLAMEHKRRQYDEAHPRDRMADAVPRKRP